MLRNVQFLQIVAIVGVVTSAFLFVFVLHQRRKLRNRSVAPYDKRASMEPERLAVPRAVSTPLVTPGLTAGVISHLNKQGASTAVPSSVETPTEPPPQSHGTEPLQDEQESEKRQVNVVAHPMDLFRAWCVGGARPRNTNAMEFSFAKYRRGEAAPIMGGKMRHIVIDAPQAAEFARLGVPGASEALLVPTPTAHYTPVMAYVFPGLARELFSPEHLRSLEPVRIVRREGGEWEILHD